MNALLRELPEGRRGQLTALGLLIVSLILLWVAVAAPLLGCYTGRAEILRERRVLLAREQQLVDSLSMLRRSVGQAGADTAAAGALLRGDTDAVAGAALQVAVHDLASAVGATLATTEVLPAQQQEAFRRIGLRVTLSGNWAVLVALLRAIDEGRLRLLVDDLQMNTIAQPQGAGSPTIDATFIVLGFRPGGEGAEAMTAAQPEAATRSAVMR